MPSLATVFALSDYYRETVVKKKGSLRDDLIRLSSVLVDTPHAIIGGVAIQPLRREPRTTDDIDVAVPSLDLIPRAKLRAAGFRGGRRFDFSENWKAPGGTAVQFSSEDSLNVPELVKRRAVVSGGGVRFQSASIPDLLRLKTEAALEPRRRPSKKLTDIQDVIDLVNDYPEAYEKLSAAGRAKVDRVMAFAETLSRLK